MKIAAQNKACMNMLKARLYEFELQKKENENSKIANTKSEIGGASNQIIRFTPIQNGKRY